jgi:uncharacterized protein YbcI
VVQQLRSTLPVGEHAAEIARFVVRTTAEATGRGPTKARAYFQGEVITVVLSDTLTKPERRLLDHGHRREVRASREAMANTIRSYLAEGVCKVTGRAVASTHISHDIDSDCMVAVFILDAEVDKRSDASRGPTGPHQEDWPSLAQRT